MVKKALPYVLLVALFYVAWVWMPWLDKKEPAAVVGVAAGHVEAVGGDLPAMTPDKFACPCAAQGVTCTGPRGGVYCVDSEGVKRYKAK